jgi:hypothetical protein
MFKELAPYVITATVIICALINRNKNQEARYSHHRRHILHSRIRVRTVYNIFEPDIQQQNNYLISLGPLLAIACLLYLRFRTKILTNGTDFNLDFSSNDKKRKDEQYFW